MAGTARRTKELAEGLCNKSHSCTVITTFPREYRSIPGYSATKEEIINKVKVFRLNNLFQVKDNVLIRMISYSMYFIKTIFWIMIHQKKFDICISVAPLASGLCGAISQKLFNIPHHFDVPDILPDLGISAGMLKNKFVIKTLYKIEKFVYNNSNSISAITKGQIKNIINKGIESQKIFYFPDWVDVDFFTTNMKKFNSKIKEKIKDDPNLKIISFVGNIGALQGVEIFLELSKLLDIEKKIKYKFMFIGDGIMLESLKCKAIKENLTNVEFVGRVPREFVPSYMNQSDILVANYLNNSYMEICIPGKTYEYIVTQTPIVIGAKGEAADLIYNFHAGVAVEPMNVTEMKKAIYEILANYGSYQTDYQNFVLKYDVECVINHYNSFLEKRYKVI